MPSKVLTSLPFAILLTISRYLPTSLSFDINTVLFSFLTAVLVALSSATILEVSNLPMKGRTCSLISS
jgi:hypothetical protein